MSFPEEIKVKALVACKRRCCLCEKHAHTLMECHHIIPVSDGGDDSFENCIPLCLECHGRVQSYNREHPIGNKYRPDELKQRRDEFYAKMKRESIVEQLPPRTDPEVLDITPEDLEKIFAEKTDAQAQRQIAALIGKWMKVNGPLADFSDDGRLFLSNHRYPETLFHLWMLFTDEPSVSLLSNLNKGRNLTVQGQIQYVNGLGVQLIYCELVNC